MNLLTQDLSARLLANGREPLRLPEVEQPAEAEADEPKAVAAE